MIPKMEKAIKNAIKNNILVVCAAGNEGDGNADILNILIQLLM